MNQTKINIISNFAGKFVAAFLGIIFVPMYLRYLGVEMYGIIGFFTSIQAFLLLFDSGISPTLNREVARLSVFPEKAQELRDLSRTLEVLCWAIGGSVCLIALLASPAAASFWLKSENVPAETIRQALMLMSVTFAFQWAVNFYAGGLFGLQAQKILNLINIFIAFVRAFGAIFVLAYISPTIEAFVLWQLFTTALNCLLVSLSFWRKLPKTAVRPRFNSALLKELWRYAMGMAGTNLVVLVLTQTDKLILSKMLTLEEFGYYSLAITLAGTGIGMIVGSIQTTYFPQFSQLVAQDKIEDMRELYHRACQVMSFFLIPAVAVLAFFSYQILLLWTQKQEIADKTYILLTLVALGTGLNGLMHLPYSAQLAFGVTRIGFWQNVLAVVFLIPFMIYATYHYGAVGGALSWVLLNFSYTIFGLLFMHRLILKGELKKWYLVDVGLPLLLALGVNGAAYLVLSRGGAALDSPIRLVLFVGITFFITMAFNMVSIPAVRNFWMSRFLRYEQ